MLSSLAFWKRNWNKDSGTERIPAAYMLESTPAAVHEAVDWSASLTGSLWSFWGLIKTPTLYFQGLSVWLMVQIKPFNNLAQKHLDAWLFTLFLICFWSSSAKMTMHPFWAGRNVWRHGYLQWRKPRPHIFDEVQKMLYRSTARRA